MPARPSYPVVLIPPKLEAALSAQPTLTPLSTPPPREADHPVHLSTGKSLLSTLYGLFGLKAQATELTAPERLQAQRQYQAEVTRHEQRQAEHLAQQAAAWTPARLSEFRRRRLAALLESSVPPRPGESGALAGVAEAHLYTALHRHFPGLIFRRQMLRAGSQEYHPDYVLHDPGSRLHIDIELDEPYALRLKTPVHIVSWEEDKQRFVPLDDARDQAFLDAGWAVVRFSETQAVRDPDGCARVVGDVLERLTAQKTASLAKVTAVQLQPRWTREDANRLAAADSRTELLKGIVQGRAAPVARPVERPFIPSPHQERIFEFLERGQGHGLVVAVAGSGKSTTLLQAVRRVRQHRPGARIALLAFNRGIRDELREKVRAAGLMDVMVATLNGFGHQVLQADLEAKVPAKVTRNKAQGMLSQAARELNRPLSKEQLKQALDLYGLFQGYVHLDPADPEAFDQLAVQYSVRDARPLQAVIVRALSLGVERYQRRGEITLDEQNYLPVRLNLPVTPYDFVFVDECQDLTQTQLELVRRAAGPAGRLLFVGDPRQAIMGFRGADNDSVVNIQALEPAPTELPLTVCYRCPTSHLELARALMPSIEAAPGARTGAVHELEWDEAFVHVREGDLLFARSRKGVERVALELLARGLTLDYVAVKSGPDDEDGGGSAHVSRVVTALQRASLDFDPRSAPTSRPTLTPGDAPLERLVPWVLGRLHRQAQRWDGGDFQAYVELATRPDERLGVRVASGHQAKGLEAGRVFVMGYPQFTPSPRQGTQAWVLQQEKNLRYVALTRAKETLYLVGDPK